MNGVVGNWNSDGRRELGARGASQLNHAPRQVESHGSPGTGALRREEDVAGTAGKIEHPVGRPDGGELHQPPLPPAILAVRQQPRDEVVAIRDGGEQPPDVLLFAFGSGDGIAQRGTGGAVFADIGGTTAWIPPYT
jgi:hypothetical protein